MPVQASCLFTFILCSFFFCHYFAYVSSHDCAYGCVNESCCMLGYIPLCFPLASTCLYTIMPL